MNFNESKRNTQKGREFIVENAITNLDTGEKMEGRFFAYEISPHNIPENWKNIKVSIKDSSVVRVV